MKKYKPERSSFVNIDDKGWRGRASKHIFGSKSKRSKAITEIISNPNGYTIFQHKLENLKGDFFVSIWSKFFIL